MVQLLSRPKARWPCNRVSRWPSPPALLMECSSCPQVEKRKARRKDLQENQRLAALRAKEQQKKKASSAEPGENKA